MDKMGYKQLLSAAEARIETIAPADAIALHGQPGVVFVDVRDSRELARDGMIPGAVHSPRGGLEFSIDPESPYFKRVFAEGSLFVFYCSAGWRSALATQTALGFGLTGARSLAGGLNAWKAANGPVAAPA